MGRSGVLLDNDVVLKACAWGLADSLLSVTTGPSPPACLGVARFSIRARLSRWRGLGNVTAARTCFESIVGRLAWLEPTPTEIAFAAELEDRALRGGFELDGGESQLAAIMVGREFALLLTGDKRAVVALGAVAATEAGGRLACLEQWLATICDLLGDERVRAAICGEAGVDKAAAIAFSCAGWPVDPRPALASYVRHLRLESPALIDGDALPPVVPQEDGVGGA